MSPSNTSVDQPNLHDRLKSLLIDSPSKSSSLPRPLIQVLDSDDGKVKNRSKTRNFRYNTDTDDVDLKLSDEEKGNNIDDTDETPPPIFGNSWKMNGKVENKSYSLDHDENVHNAKKRSLAEQMLADALLATEERQKLQSQREELMAKKSTFGVKRGFLNSSSKNVHRKGKTSTREISKNMSRKEDKTTKKVVQLNGGKQDELVYELDNEGNIIPSSPLSIDDQQSRGRDPLHFMEVQSAMLSYLESNADIWGRTDLMETILQRHPKLARGIHDPRYMSALQGIQSNPKETMENLKKNSPEIVDWLKEFCGVMGEHFVKLGDEQGKATNNSTKKGAASQNASIKLREIGPLEKKALQSHSRARNEKDTRQRSEDDTTSTKDMDVRVSSILADDELRSILMDPVMQQVMEECSTGNKLRYYMGHDEYGPKLLKLLKAGLIRMA